MSVVLREEDISGAVHELPVMNPRLEGCSYIDIGTMPGEAAMAEQVDLCTPCGKRLMAAVDLEKFKRLVAAGMSNDQAMTAVGITRWCCRKSFSAYMILPTAKNYYDPDVVKGLSTVANPEPWTKWRGNMRRNIEGGSVMKIGRGEVPPPCRTGPPEAYGFKIPQGYRFVKWLRVDNDWTGKQDPVWTIHIVRTLPEARKRQTVTIAEDQMENEWEVL